MDEINDATDRVIAGLEGRPLQAGDRRKILRKETVVLLI